jgi:hypothetical protein
MEVQGSTSIGLGTSSQLDGKLTAEEMLTSSHGIAAGDKEVEEEMLSWDDVVADVDKARQVLEVQQGTAGSRVTLEYDLCDLPLMVPCSAPPLVLPAGLRLHMASASIVLPEGCILEVGPGASLDLSSVLLTGGSAHDKGLVTVRGPGASAFLDQCTIRGASSDEGRCHAVLVAEGGAATLDSCTFDAATGDGLRVEATGSTATAVMCTAASCAGAGYSASGGALLTAELSAADGNGSDGFSAAGPETQLKAGPECVAIGNRSAGFSASQGGRLTAFGKCLARNNLMGFSVSSGAWLEVSGVHSLSQ